jgi:hypothetical protein
MERETSILVQRFMRASVSKVMILPLSHHHSLRQRSTNLFSSKKQPNREEYRKWLKKLSPSKQDIDNISIKITYSDVRKAIKELANNKATGLDEIPAEVYKVLADLNEKKSKDEEEKEDNTFITALMLCFNAYMLNSTPIPDSWRTSVMILLYKGGDKLDIANFRPITLISVMYKTYANILAKRLSQFVEKNDVLSIAQAGFRRQRGPAQKLLGIDAAIKTAKRTNGELHLLSLDIKKAFDSVEHWLIEETLGIHGLNLPNHFIKAIMDTLHNNRIKIRTDSGLTEEVTVDCGVRQGDPLSTTLFALVIDPLIQRLAAIQGLKLTEGPQAYADDIDFLAHSAQMMENAWKIIEEFLNLTGLELNAKKTVYLRNHKAQQNKSKAQMLLDKKPIKMERADTPFKVLGVWFTMDRDWNRHKELTRGSCIGKLKLLAQKKITDYQYIEVVNIMILSALSYGMMVVDYTEAELNELNGIIHSFARRRLHLTIDPNGWEDWLTLNRDKGGKGLYTTQQKSVTSCTQPSARSRRPNR